MSKQRKKHNNSNANNGPDLNNFDLNNMGNLFNNINPNQLASMLNGIDINQLSGILQNFSGKQNSGNNSPKQSNNSNSNGNNSRSIELLNAMKPLVDAEKSQLIDSIIQLYTISKIIKK